MNNSLDAKILLRKLAKCILATLDGPGAWISDDDDEPPQRLPEKPDPKECLSLAFGDTVYWYCDEEEEVNQGRCVGHRWKDVPLIMGDWGRTAWLALKDEAFLTPEDRST